MEDWVGVALEEWVVVANERGAEEESDDRSVLVACEEGSRVVDPEDVPPEGEQTRKLPLVLSAARSVPSCAPPVTVLSCGPMRARLHNDGVRGSGIST